MLDEDFLFAMASKASATYISSHISDDGEGTVFFSLSDWDNLKLPYRLMAGMAIRCPASLICWMQSQRRAITPSNSTTHWWLARSGSPMSHYFTVTPLAYDLTTLDGQFVLPDGSSYRLDDLDEVSYDEMTDYFDGIIEVDGDTMLGVKRSDDDTVNVSKSKANLLPGVGIRRAGLFSLPSSSGVFHERPFYLVSLRDTVGSNTAFHSHHGRGYSTDQRNAGFTPASTTRMEYGTGV